MAKALQRIAGSSCIDGEMNLIIPPHLPSKEKLDEVCLEIRLSKLVSMKNGIIARLFCGED